MPFLFIFSMWNLTLICNRIFGAPRIQNASKMDRQTSQIHSKTNQKTNQLKIVNFENDAEM